MASTGFLGVSLPCNPVWNMRETLYVVREGPWGEPSRYSSVRRGPCMRPSRCRGRMQDWYLPRYICGTRPSSQERREGHILRSCGVARRVQRSEGQVRGQSLEATEVLEEGYCEDGVSLGVRHRDAERRPIHLRGYTKGIPTISSPSAYTGLVRVPLLRQVLSICCTALRLRAVNPMVYNADSHLRGVGKKICLSHTGISRRISNSPFFTRGGKYKVSLCCRSRPRRQVDEQSLSHNKSR